MAKSPLDHKHSLDRTLPKAPTGIQGLDEITQGGFPRGRPTLVCGSAGCGKTLLSMEFLVRGATEYGEPGVFIAFEENTEELAQNVRSLGFDLNKLVRQKKLVLDFVRVESRRGAIVVRAQVVKTIRPDTVFVPYHWPNSWMLTGVSTVPILLFASW